MLSIYIPSYRRADIKLAQVLCLLPRNLGVTVVVRPEEEHDYKRLCHDQLGNMSMEVLPIGQPGVLRTRNAILDEATRRGESHVAILDDDINFLIRRDDHAYHLRGATEAEVRQMFQEIDETLEEYVHIGVSGREGNNRVLEDAVENTRMMRFVALDLEVLNKHQIRYRLENREDFDLTLQLLTLGYPNLVYYKYAQGQKNSGMEGGLSGSPVRTADAMAANAHELAELWPGLVKVVEKTTKTSFGGGTRTDVVIYWKKAYEKGKALAEDRGRSSC